jgi:hypothetical protein
MKKIRFILIVVFLISFSGFTGLTVAQEKSKEEKERELRMQEEINAQKKTIAEQKKAQEELQKAFEDQQKEVDKALKEAEEGVDNATMYEDLARHYKGTGDWSYFNREPYVFTPGIEAFTGRSYDGDNEKTKWDFSKSVKETSFSRDYTFDVESTVSTVVMAVNGDCRAGEIKIKILMPNGKVYSDILIDEFGNLNWRKSFTISEDENKDKAGAWKFQINASKATGYFRISLQTY